MTNILHKRSNVPAKVPLITDLLDGEISVNTHDGRLFIKTTVDTVESIIPISNNYYDLVNTPTFSTLYGVTVAVNGTDVKIGTPQDLQTTASPTFSALSVTNNVGIGGNLNVTGTTGLVGDTTITGSTSLTGPAVIYSSNTSVDYSTGALTVVGGVGIGGNLNVAGNSKVTGTSTLIGNTSITSTTAATSTTTGALTVVGGVGIGGELHVGNGLTVTRGGYTWKFKDNGMIELPEHGDIVDNLGGSVLTQTASPQVRYSVRYDIDNQNLFPFEQKNARLNIDTLSSSESLIYSMIF